MKEDESISNAQSVLKLRLHINISCKVNSFSTTTFLSTPVCSCCALDQSAKLRSYTVRTESWNKMEFWKDSGQLKKKPKSHTHWWVISVIRLTSSPKPVLLWHKKARSQNTTGAKRKGESGNVLTGFQKTREGLISITAFIFEMA